MKMDQKKRICERDALKQDQDARNPAVMKLYHLVDEINAAVKRCEENIPDTMHKYMDYDLHAIISSCEEWLVGQPMKTVGNFLHKSRVNEPAYDDVKKMIAAFPEALMYKNEIGWIPIQSGLDDARVKYVPLLAMETYQRDILIPMRGGLLLPYYCEYNVLQWVVHRYCDDIRLQVLKDLRNANLLLDQDIVQYNLIGAASCKACFKHLNYLLEVYPKALSMPQPCNGNFPIHPSNSSSWGYCVGVFEKILTAGMEHYPEKLGFLFQPNAKGEMPITQAIDKYGKDGTLQAIVNAIPSTEHCPILHHVFQYTPDLCEDFVSRYPDAVICKDGQGRNLLHVALENGLNLSDSVLTTICNKQCIAEKDPVTGLYPFMLAAASGFDNGLTVVHRLLTFSPEVVSWCFNDNGMDDIFGQGNG